MIPSHFLSITQRCLCRWNAFCPSSAEYVFNQVSIPDQIFFLFETFIAHKCYSRYNKTTVFTFESDFDKYHNIFTLQLVVPP